MLNCPKCKETLVRVERSYKCTNNHTYDIAKEGYTNLLLKQSSKMFGDSKDMILARHDFFLKDFYLPLKKKLTTILSSLNIHSLLDSGCGEGYYTNYFKDTLNHINIIGFDIAKDAVKVASKKNKDVLYLVASVHEIPVMNQSMDAIINIFAPLSLSEYSRILKDKGYLIVVSPNIKHLYQLKKAIYDSVIDNEIFEVEEKDFVLVDTQYTSFELSLDTNKDVVSLFSMTPYVYKTSLKDKEKLNQINQIKIDADFIIRIYQKVS